MKYILTLILLFSTSMAYAIDMEAIEQIESSGNPNAYNKHSQAIGLFQITPICLKEYNNYNNTTYTQDDLYNPHLNRKIADWYLHKRIPQMLRYYKKQVNYHNVLISYNAGISYVIKRKSLPVETLKYLDKYRRLLGRAKWEHCIGVGMKYQ